MRWISVVTVIAAVALAAPSGPATAAADSAAKYRRCAGTFGPRGEPGQGFFRAIRAKRVSCPAARRIIRAYLRSGMTTRPKRVRGYSCRVRVGTPSDPEEGKLRCVRGSRAIRAAGHP